MKVEQLKRPRIQDYAFSISTDWGNEGQYQLVEVLEWVILNVGSITEKTWDIRGLGSNKLTFYFSDESDAGMFKLRWTE